MERMTLDQALFQRDGYQRAYEQARSDLAELRARVAQLETTGRALLDAMDTEDVSGGDGTERAYDELRAVLDGDATPTDR